jgi:hypothetical protein
MKIIDLNKALEAKQAHLYRLAQAQKLLDFTCNRWTEPACAFGGMSDLNRFTGKIMTKEKFMALDSRLTFRLQGDDLFELHRIAQAEGISISNAVRMLIRTKKAPVTRSLPESTRSGIWPLFRR